MLHPNFYENLDEMQRRILGTVVTYAGDPVMVAAITNHKSDGIFRIYHYPVEKKVDSWGPAKEYPQADPRLGPAMDKWLEENKDSPIVRKQANSPAYNRFRPFSLGMMNSGGTASFLERSPTRRTQQGLIRQMVEETLLDTMKGTRRQYSGALGGPDFHACVKGTHPSAEECMDNLLDPSVENDSVACHRNFAIIRGPLDTFFLNYKGDVVGFIPPAKRPTVELGKKFNHLKEAVEETRQFHDIRVRA